MTLNWVWHYLAAFPEVQRKAQEEVDRVVGELGQSKFHCSAVYRIKYQFFSRWLNCVHYAKWAYVIMIIRFQYSGSSVNLRFTCMCYMNVNVVNGDL